MAWSRHQYSCKGSSKHQFDKQLTLRFRQLERQSQLWRLQYFPGMNKTKRDWIMPQDIINLKLERMKSHERSQRQPDYISSFRNMCTGMAFVPDQYCIHNSSSKLTTALRMSSPPLWSSFMSCSLATITFLNISTHSLPTEHTKNRKTHTCKFLRQIRSLWSMHWNGSGRTKL